MTEPRDKALSDLEWNALLTQIAGNCTSDLGSSRVRALTPLPSHDEATARARVVEQALATAMAGEPVPAAAVSAIDEVLEHFARAGVASAEDLWNVQLVMAAGANLQAFARQIHAQYPELARAIGGEGDVRGLRDAILKCIEPGGHIRDKASPALATARNEARTSRRRMLDALDKLTARYQDVLRDGSYVERDGRYGLPVRADAHRKVEGIVLGASSTGATLYVEPPQVTALANKTRIVQADVEREELRILTLLSGKCGEQLDTIRAAYEAAIDADVLAALARWGGEARAHVISPNAEPRIDLRAMRHPLLASDDAIVANNIALESGRALVISGPNAGGKTVALKCLGLAALMARAAIPIPAGAETTVGWFTQVLTDIGDEQSIARSLSSFSAEISLLAAYLPQIEPGALVLLDELAGGTDPDQGAALAVAILEALVDGGAAVGVTTHYGRLKEIASEDERFINASVGFDFDRMLPTFKLTTGVPGPSSALAVAKRFGLPEPVVTRAEQLQSGAAKQSEALLAQLERERVALDEQHRSAKLDGDAAATLRRELEHERKHVRSKERSRLEREASVLTSQIRDARATLRQVQEEVRSGTIDPKKAAREIDTAARAVALGSDIDRHLKQNVAKPAAPSTKPVGSLKPGMTVFVQRLNGEAVVTEAPSKGQVRVRAGAFTLRVPLSEVRALSAKPAGNQAQPQSKAQRHAQKKRQDGQAPRTRDDRTREVRAPDLTVSLRGMHVEEALETLDRFVSDLIGRNEPVGFALHGHGTGVLKKVVREHLAASPHVRDRRPATQEEGGDAFTVFWLT